MVDLMPSEGAIQLELVELEERIHRLGDLFDTDTFKSLDPLHRTTLGSQFMAMNQYATCLRMRLLVAHAGAIETILKDEEPSGEHIS